MSESVEQFNQSLSWRYATKQFDCTKHIPDELFEQILETLRLSPSSFGLQPWKFVVVEDMEVRKRLRLHTWNQSQVTDASRLIVLCARAEVNAAYIDRYIEILATGRKLKREELEPYRIRVQHFVGQMSEPDRQAWVTRQIYLALGVLLSACAVARVDACPMEGLEPEKYDEILGLAELGLRTRVVCALGYRSGDDWLAKLPKVRFCKDEVVLRI